MATTQTQNIITEFSTHMDTEKQTVAQDSDFYCSCADLEYARSYYTVVSSVVFPYTDRTGVPSHSMTVHPWRLVTLRSER
jgi:hypothetical protein